eukprot:9443090-Pyramimonas_sp.AAC.1
MALKSAEEVAGVILRDEVAVLLNMNGHTEGDRMDVMRSKSAPVQGVGWGWTATYQMPDAAPYILTGAPPPTLYCTTLKH